MNVRDRKRASGCSMMMTNAHKLLLRLLVDVVVSVCLPLFSRIYFTSVVCFFFSFVHCCWCCALSFTDVYYMNICPWVLITSYFLCFDFSLLLHYCLEDCILLLQCRFEPEWISCSYRTWCIWNSCNRLHKSGKKYTSRQHKEKEKERQQKKHIVKWYFHGILYHRIHFTEP